MTAIHYAGSGCERNVGNGQDTTEKVTKYYQALGRVIAFRKDGVLYWVGADHLLPKPSATWKPPRGIRNRRDRSLQAQLIRIVQLSPWKCCCPCSPFPLMRRLLRQFRTLGPEKER